MSAYSRISDLLVTMQVPSLAKWCNRSSPRILAYHGIDQLYGEVLDHDAFFVSPGRFREQLQLLKEKYSVVSLQEIREAIGRGKALPPNAVAITFDDGYLNNLTIAAPILREFDIPATFFVTTGFIEGAVRPWWFELRHVLADTGEGSWTLPDGSILGIENTESKCAAAAATEKLLRNTDAAARDRYMESLGASDRHVVPMMTWEDVKALAGMGFDVSPHTVTHISFGHEKRESIEREIVESCGRITSATGKPPKHYAYPYGGAQNINDDTIATLKNNGIELAVTTEDGLVRMGDDPYRLPRINISGRHRGPGFELLVSGLKDMVMPR